MSDINIGDKAPDFTLQNTEGEEISLSALKKDGNVVILFFPLAFSSVCTKEVCTTRDNLKIYNALNARVVGISVDSFFTLKAFKVSNNLNFPLLSDFNKEVSKTFGVLDMDFFGMKGVSKRSVFVVGTDGNILHKEILDDVGNMPDLAKVQTVLAEAG